jgi:prephenate dehydrogenase
VSAEDGFRRVGIVGVGLIGGSIAFATRRTFPSATVVGVDRDAVIDAARQLGALHAGSTDLRALEGCDLVVLSAPVRQNAGVLARLGEAMTGEALVTDAGSTKRAVVEAARALPPRLTFIGGHPLAGSARAASRPHAPICSSAAPGSSRRAPMRRAGRSAACRDSSPPSGRRRSSSVRVSTTVSWPSPATCRSSPPPR